MRAKVLISRGKERVQHHSLNFHQQISNSKVKVRVSMRKQKWESKSESEGWKCNLISRGKQRVQQQQPQKFLFVEGSSSTHNMGNIAEPQYLPKPIKIMLSRQFPTHQSLMVKPLESAICPQLLYHKKRYSLGFLVSCQSICLFLLLFLMFLILFVTIRNYFWIRVRSQSIFEQRWGWPG